MAAKANLEDYVKKQTMYIAVVIALVVGALGGIIFSSVNSDNYGVPVAQQGGGPGGPPQQASGLSPQQASTILALEQRVASNPSDAAAWTQLGNTYFDASKFQKAIRAYSKSLELRPADPNVLTDLGVMYRRNGQPTDAIKAFEGAIAANPNHEQARFNKGIVLMYDLGDITGAIATWQELLAKNPAATASNGIPISQIIAEAQAKLPAGGQAK